VPNRHRRSASSLNSSRKARKKCTNWSGSCCGSKRNPLPARCVELFRTLHTIKGATSFLGFTKLCGLAHGAEKLLVRLRDGTLACSPQIVNALLSLVDAIRKILSEISANGREGAKDYSDLAHRLATLQKNG